MAQKKPSKIIFCHYNYPLVEELAEFYSSKLQQATNIVDIQNQVIAQAGGKLDHKFYFLNATIGKETHIITAAGQKHYPTNDPAIVAKLEAYLVEQESGRPGGFKKRGVYQVTDHVTYPKLEEQTLLKQKVKNEQTAIKIVQELRLIYFDRIEATHIKMKERPAIRVASWYLPYDVLKKAIEDIINS